MRIIFSILKMFAIFFIINLVIGLVYNYNDSKQKKEVVKKEKNDLEKFNSKVKQKEFVFKKGKCSSLDYIREANHFKEIKSNGKKIRIAVVDTGIDLTNEVLTSNIPKIEGENFFGYDLVDGDYYPSDDHGHGSHISGIILAINPNVEIIPIKYYKLTDSSEKNSSRYMKALKIAIDLNVDIINSSGGGDEPFIEEQKIMDEMEKRGIIFVGAIGNDSRNLDEGIGYYPASYSNSNIIRVGNVNDDYKIAESSNYTYNHDVFARGTEIKSFGNNQDRCIVKLTGTSQSAAVVSGYISNYYNKFIDRQKNIKQIKNLLSDISKKDGRLKKLIF